MICTRRDVVSSAGAGRLLIALALLTFAFAPFLAVTPAQGSMGYELSKSNPVLVSGIEFPHGVAVDQVDHRVYVAVVTDDASIAAPGRIRRFESNGQSAGFFLAGSGSYFSGVAIDPVTHGFYGAEMGLHQPSGDIGKAQMNVVSSAGILSTTFPLSFTETLPQIATDSTGDVYFPNAALDSVQVFNSAGVLQESIACGGCPGGPFGKPASVAVDSAGDLYVADLAPDRVVKLTSSGGSYSFDAVLQSGRGAVAVGVDPSTDDVFVGDLLNGKDYHVVAYDSSGSQFDDFGAGLFINPPLGTVAAAQIAADATTHKLYLTETNKIYVFDRVTIGPPSAIANSASEVSQLDATLNATVNAKGHATLGCEFEVTDDADVSFVDATSLPCPTMPDGTIDRELAVKASGLSADTAYRYRVTATNNAGSVTSDSKSFETLPIVPPDVTTESPPTVTQVAATIKGKVNPHGGLASKCYFEFGTSASYGSTFACTTLPPSVTTDVVKTREISGLAPNTSYHYQLVVTTNAGTAKGGDVVFTTQGLVESKPEPAASGPPAPEPAPAPEPVVTPPAKCREGFRRQQTSAGDRCVKVCKKGFRKKVVSGKVRCVKKKPPRGRSRSRASH